MKSREELYEYFKTDLLPGLQQLEDIRKMQVFRQVFILAALVISITLSLILVLPTMLLVFLAIFLIIYFLVFGFRRKRFDIQTSYKESVLRKVNAFLLPGTDFTHFQFIRQPFYMESKLFIPDADIYDGEDLVKGSAENIAFQFSKIHTQERIVDSDGKVQLSALFKGYFFLAELPQSVESDIYIFGDTSERFINAFYSHFSDINTLNPEVLNTGSSAFEKYFAAYSTDTDAAERLCSDQCRQLMLQFVMKNEIKPQVSVIKNYVYIALPERKDVFALNMYKSILHMDAIEKYYNYLQFCFAVSTEILLQTGARTTAG